MPGDYDGDGKYDLAVFDNNTGNWFILTVDGQLLLWARSWGWGGATPVPGDYDSDGNNDLAVYDNTSGCWHITTVNGTLLTWGTQWGGAYSAPGAAW